jgi:hypothetical protein
MGSVALRRDRRAAKLEPIEAVRPTAPDSQGGPSPTILAERGSLTGSTLDQEALLPFSLPLLRSAAFALLAIAAWPAASQPVSGEVRFFCSFENSPTECGFREQAKVPGRATLVNFGRHGGSAVRLHTEPDDTEVSGSRQWTRNDLTLRRSASYCNQGQEEWWAHSILFPDDYVASSLGVVMDFHHSGATGQANFHVDALPNPGGLRFRGYGGANVDGGRYMAPIGPIMKNVWYDFVYHVRWSSDSDGFFIAWVNGRKKLDHRGPRSMPA